MFPLCQDREPSPVFEVSKAPQKQKRTPDGKKHSFAKDGFTYRRAYFEDFDGQYYEVTLSIGHNGTVATVYNVGKIDKSTLPSAKIIAVVGSKPLGKVLSNKSIRNSEQNVNENFEELVGSPKKLPVSKDITDRAMLADMFEQMVTNSNEYKALENYRKHMQEMLDIEEHLERISAEIHRLSFSEGPRDMETLNKLKLQQKQAVNKLNTYDNILLRLEKSGVLRAMIERNRKQITQESYARAKEYYRERNERRESELRQYYRESRRKAVERHDMAHKKSTLD